MILASKLVRLAVANWESIAGRVVARLHSDPEVEAYKKIPEEELRERTREILMEVEKWPVFARGALASRYEQIGRRRLDEGVPLHQMVHALQIIKYEMIAFIRDQGVPSTTVEIYAEEELEHGINRVFDRLTYHLVRGYELALPEKLKGELVRAAGSGGL